MKVSGWVIICIALAFGLCTLAFAWWDVYQPNETAAGYMANYLGQLDTQAGHKAAAEARVRTAIKMVGDASKDWDVYVDSKTPANSLPQGINIMENPYQLVVDSPKYRNSAQRAFNTQLRVGGVKIVSAPQIPDPGLSEADILASYYNYPGFSFPVVLWELGSVTVTGTYAQIMKNVRSWSNMPHYLAVVDGLKLDGTAPILTASYNVTIVGFIKAKSMYPTTPSNVEFGEATSSTGSGSMGSRAPGAAATGMGAGPSGATGQKKVLPKLSGARVGG